MTTMRSDSAIASSWSWVTRIVVVPTRALDLAQLDLHLLAQLGVEIGQRLVEQQHVRPDHERAGQRHALLLAAGHPPRIAIRERPDSPTSASASATRFARSARGDAPHLEAEGDVLGRRS